MSNQINLPKLNSLKKMRKYTTITVPTELKNKIEQLARKKGYSALWRVINDALTFYENIEKKPKLKKNLSEIDKCAWYIYKFSKSVSLFLENPTDENYLKLRERIYQDLSGRIFGKTTEDLFLLDKLITQYKKIPSKDLKIQINDLTKKIIVDIITTFLSE